MRKPLLLLCSLVLTGCVSNPPQSPQITRITPEQLEQLLPPPQPNMSLQEIIRLGKAGESPETIIGRIRESGSTYQIAPSQVIQLHADGVSARVLDVMAEARERLVHEGFANEINKREKAHEDELRRMELRLLMRPNCYCDPFYGRYPPYGGYPYLQR